MRFMRFIVTDEIYIRAYRGAFIFRCSTSRCSVRQSVGLHFVGKQHTISGAQTHKWQHITQ